MNIQFCEHGSRLYDFFNLFAYKEHILNRREEEKGYNDVCYTLFLSLLNKAKNMFALKICLLRLKSPYIYAIKGYAAVHIFL